MRSSRSCRFAAFSVAAAFVFILSGCRSSQPVTVGGLAPIRLQLDWYPQPEHGGFFAAQLLGYYRAEGLDLTLLPLPQYGSAAQLVASGKADLGLDSSDAISGVEFQRSATRRCLGYHAARPAGSHGPQ